MSRHHADFLSAYVETLTPRGEAPERFHYWCAVSTIGGALRRRVYIDEGTFRWYPNFYVVLVGPPGTVKKSTTISVGARLLRDVPNVNIGADCSTWQSFVEEVAAAQDMFAEGDPVVPSADIAESLAEQDHTVTCALTLTISEWGTFINPEDRDMINVLTELWDCKINTAFTKKTKTQGSDTIMNPFVNMIAGTTPDWMRDNFRGRFGGWGFSSRCIFLHCEQPERFIAYPHKVWRGDHDNIMSRFRDDLIEISRMQGKYTLSPDAEEFGEQWYVAHMKRKVALDRHPNHDPWLSYYLARKFDHAHKLAIVTAASRRTALTITLDDLQDSIKRCDEVEEELSLVFHSKQAQHRDAKLNMDVWNGIAKAIRENGRLEERRLYSYTIQWMTYGRAKELLEFLVVQRWLVRESEPDGFYLSFGENAQNAEAKSQNGDAR